VAMKPEYKVWIAQNVKDNGYGQCDQITQEMQKAFPHLQRARGFYYCFLWGQRTHWWLVDTDDTIVDPTAAQFPSKGKGVYEEISDEEISDRVPVGVCANCGGPRYAKDDGTVCSEECGIEYIAYLNNP